MSNVTQEQAASILAKWYIQRIYLGAKGGGIGVKELSEYAEFKPGFNLPADEVIDRQGYSNLVRGKNGFEVYPEFVNVELMVAINPNNRNVTIPTNAISTEYNRYFVQLASGLRREIGLVANQKVTGNGEVEVRTGLGAGERILIKQKHPQAGHFKLEPIPQAVANLWDKFVYFNRLAARAKKEVWSSVSDENQRLKKLEIKIAEIMLQSLIIKSLPKVIG